MVKNEVGTEIPNNVALKAKAMGCLNLRYIYEDGRYGGKFPASNLGGYKSTRFRNWVSANKHKIKILDNWVLFQSPTYSNKYSRNIEIKSERDLDPSAISTTNSKMHKPSITPSIEIKRGFSVKGDMIKFGVKITNNMNYKIYDIDAKLRSPGALEFIDPKNKIVSIRSISPGASETAIFLLKPIRCVQGSIKGTVEYEDPTTDRLVSITIKPKKIESICPFIEPLELSEREFIEQSRKLFKTQMGFTLAGISNALVIKILEDKFSNMWRVEKYDCKEDILFLFSGRSNIEQMIYLMSVALKDVEGIINIAFVGYSDREEGLVGFISEQSDSVKYALHAMKGTKEIIKIEMNRAINIYDSVVNRCNLEIK